MLPNTCILCGSTLNLCLVTMHLHVIVKYARKSSTAGTTQYNFRRWNNFVFVVIGDSFILVLHSLLIIVMKVADFCIGVVCTTKDKSTRDWVVHSMSAMSSAQIVSATALQSKVMGDSGVVPTVLGTGNTKTVTNSLQQVWKL